MSGIDTKIKKQIEKEIMEGINSSSERQRRMIKVREDFGRGDSCDECGIGYYVIKEGYKTCWNCGYNPSGRYNN